MEEFYLEGFMSFLEQEYPEYELLFALSENGASIISGLEDLKKRFPDKTIRWVIIKQSKGPNYKVEKLIASINEAKYDTLVISDSDMRAGPDYLQKVIDGFSHEEAGLVTCLYRNVRLHNIYLVLQALYIQTDFIPKVLLDHKLRGISYAFGSTICTTKEIIANIGGLEDLRQYLADDYQLLEMKTFREYVQHHLRWAITQRICRPLGYFASLITQSVTLAMLFLFLEGFTCFATGLFLSVCAMRFISSAFINRTVIGNGEVNRFLWLIPLKDLWNSVIWVISLFANTVRWKNRRFRVRKGGKMVEV
jgi:ceramide glucosyltransferase